MTRLKKSIYLMLGIFIVTSISLTPIIGNEKSVTEKSIISSTNDANIEKNHVNAASVSYWKKLFKKVGPTYFKVTNNDVTVKGRCSCGKKGSYKLYNAKFKNYCPYCKKPGYLTYEQGRTCPEGMWVCKKCDADFCLVTGKEHIRKKPKFLKRTTTIDKVDTSKKDDKVYTVDEKNKT